MILCDYNQMAIANVMQQTSGGLKNQLDANLIRHMVLNSLRSYAKQFKDKYGNIVIACDSKRYWRRDFFPFYKSHRKDDREKSAIDWSLIFNTLAEIKDELRENFPYKVIEVEGAEADDIIGVLVKNFHNQEDILILSADKDFVQLQKFKGVTQYSPILKRYMRVDNPHEYIQEHIIRGDRGDGIPNFLSPDNTFAVGERQKVISKKKLSQWIGVNPLDFCVTDTMLRGYKRNQMLVDLDYIPEKIADGILETYNNTKSANKQKMISYLIEKRMKNLFDVADEF